jgi:hypothetical protein
MLDKTPQQADSATAVKTDTQTLLDAFLHTESVVNDYKCNMCGHKGGHKQTQHLLRVPPLLVLQFKRYVRREKMTVKQSGTVHVAEGNDKVRLHYSAMLPTTISAAAVAAANTSMAGPARRRTAQYRLRCIVSHMGLDPNVGHYIASVYAPPPVGSNSEGGNGGDGERAVSSSRQEEKGVADDTDEIVNVADRCRRRPREENDDHGVDAAARRERFEAAYSWVEADDSTVCAQTCKEARPRVEGNSYLLLYERR